jgi:hypothetical protein
MKAKRGTRAEARSATDEWHAAKHRERVALTERVRRGEITAWEANCEASVFRDAFDPARAVTDWARIFADLRKLDGHESRKRRPRRRHAKAVRA